MRLVQIGLAIFVLELAGLLSYHAGWIFMPDAPDEAQALAFMQSAVRSRQFGREATPPLESWREARVAVEAHGCELDGETLSQAVYYCAARLSFSPPDAVEYQGMWLIRNRGIQFRLDLDNAETFIGFRVEYARPSGKVVDWRWMDVYRLPDEYRKKFISF